MKKYVADFETSTEKWMEIDTEARVWATCIATVEEHPKIVSIDNSLDVFMEKIIKLGNIELYFHNLKFDGEYILAWLFSNGYKWMEKPTEDKSFTTVISDQSQWYKIEITHKKYNKKYIRTNIYDSLKKIPLKVANIAKTFNLSTLKGEIDYDKYRPIGYELDEVETEYIKNDCLIVAQALYIQFERGLEKLTIGADALYNFKEDIGGRKAFEYLYPVMPYEADCEFRKSYKGGFTMVNERYRNKIVSGISFDVNSLYPSVMYGNMGLLPYGRPKIFYGEYEYDPRYPLYMIKIHCRFKLKEGRIPSIQLKGNLLFKETEYIRDSGEIVDMVLTNVDFELFKEQYDILYIDYVGGYKFKGTDKLFKDYIDYWMKIKATSTGGQRQLAKLMLNSLYGKFATNPKKRNRIPKVSDQEIILEMSEPNIEKPVYTPLGSFITAYARRYTISNSQALYPYWVYSDTDSMYLTGITEEEARKYINVHPSNLGAWKLEHHFTKGKWLRAKTYIITSTEDGTTISCAGMPDNIKEDILSKGEDEAFKLFTYGSSFSGKLMPQRVKGGVILKNIDFTIAPLT